jgi:hypothetical protein
MFYVYSTATCPIDYVVYRKNTSNDLGVIEKHPNGKPMRVSIKGGHGLANKNIVTPRGVATQVSDEDMQLLLDDKLFQRHMKAGFMSYDKKNVDPEKKAASMEDKDGSAPLTPQDFEESDNSTNDNKIYKKKGAA